MNLCACQCGTEVAPTKKFAHGHNRRRYPHGWREEGRGFATPCHIWLGSLSTTGYAMGSVDGRYGKMHNLLWTQANGSLPEGLELDHLCGQRNCVRLDHLESVTHHTNMQRSRNAKVSWEDVLEIRASTLPKPELAHRFGISVRQVYKILDEEAWSQ